jgi:glucoamylase
MPRDLPLGNGRLLYAFDARYQLRDVYFPQVGRENHTDGSVSRIGIWAGGRFAWLHDDTFVRRLGYRDRTLVGRSTFDSADLGLRLEISDCVDFHEMAYVRRVDVTDSSGTDREIRLYIHHDLRLEGNNVGDTAYFDPFSGTVIHYKTRHYLLCGGMRPVGGAATAGLDGYATGQTGIGGALGTWKDAEDGSLSGNPIAQGSVDSVIQLSAHLPASASVTLHTWDLAGSSVSQVHKLHAMVVERGPDEFIERTASYWRLWVGRDLPGAELLDSELAHLYHRSLLIIRTQTDDQGGITAANDTDILAFARDTYSYVWPRDGALTASALTEAGYHSLAAKFFEFCARVVRPEGYFLHKYSPDGSLASSWHPWIAAGAAQLPIQEDETALVIWALWRHFQATHDVEGLKPLYRALVTMPADFMAGYRDEPTGLPAPSWDLWEERRGIHAFTVGAVVGGLTAAAQFADAFGETHRAQRYRQAVSEMREAAAAHLYRPELGRFVRTLYRGESGELTADPVIDASLHGVFRFGMFDADDPRVVATMEAVRNRLWVRTEVGGCARYESDPYQRVTGQEGVEGNPWHICTLWLADHEIERAQSAADLDRALPYLRWVARHRLPSGVLAEQVNPLTDEPLSVSPLTWSHAAYVHTVNRYLERRLALAH